MKEPFENVFKHLESNCLKLSLNISKVEDTLKFLIQSIRLDWFKNQYAKRSSNKTPIFYVNPLIIDSRSPIDSALEELYYLGKYLRFFQTDKNFGHIIKMIKSENLDEYCSAVLQLKTAFFISLSKGKRVTLEPSSLTNPADIAFEVAGIKYVSEVSVLRQTQVRNYLGKSIHYFLDAIHLKRYTGLRMVMRLTFKIRCYEEKLPNLFDEFNKDVNVILRKAVRNEFNQPFAIVSKFYTLEVSPFLRNEPKMPFIVEDGKIVNFIKNWDIGFALKVASLKKGVNELEQFEDLNEPRMDTEIKFVAKFPTEDFNKNLDRLKKKIQNEFSQLKSFNNLGKLVFIAVDDVFFFENKSRTIENLRDFITDYQKLTTIILIRSSSHSYSSGNLSCLIIKNKENTYPLPEKFYKLLQRK